MVEFANLKKRKMTRFAEAVAVNLSEQALPVLTNAKLFEIMWHSFEAGNGKFIRSEFFTKSAFRRTRLQLRREGHIRQDSDYSACWRVMSKADASAEDIICGIDSHCYISHISAMQRYGLSDRRPKDLHLSRPTDPIRRGWLKEDMTKIYGQYFIDHRDEIEQAKAIIHRSRVRGRPVYFTVSRYFGEHLQIKGELARIATVAQTFLDMLDEPDSCGGIAHVLDVWANHAGNYLEEIIARVDKEERPILKVRAGYILDECMGISDKRVENWVSFAQRGSSRVLNSGKPFMPDHSEKWMLSLNV